MNIFKTKLLFLLIAGLTCVSATAMEELSRPAKTPLPTGNFDRFINEVKILGDLPYRRIFVLPYRSTGVEASQYPILDESNGTILNALTDFSKLDQPVKLNKPILINASSEYPELAVILDGPQIEGLAPWKHYFYTEEINDLGKLNHLRIEWKEPVKEATIGQKARKKKKRRVLGTANISIVPEEKMN